MGEEIQTSPQKDEPKGVGGWLLFFCIGLVALGPSRTLDQLGKMWDELKLGTVFPVIREIAAIETIVAVLVMVYGMIVGIMIWRGNRRGRTLARQYLVIRILISLSLCGLAVWWGYATFSGLVGRRVTVAIIPSTALEIGVCLLWWCYFTYSKRVRHTYGNAQKLSSY
jgi:ABC-type spermidine/putrescine transport system permease subunit II